MSFELREMKTYCARRDELKGHGNLADGKNRSRTSALLLFGRANEMAKCEVFHGSLLERRAMKSINSRFFVTRVREMAVIPLLSCKEGGEGFAEVFVLRLYSRKGNRSDTSLPKFIEQKKGAAKKQTL